MMWNEWINIFVGLLMVVGSVLGILVWIVAIVASATITVDDELDTSWWGRVISGFICLILSLAAIASLIYVFVYA